MALVAAVSCVREDAHMAQQEPVDVNLLSQKSINTAEDAVAGTLAVLLQENVADALAAGQSVSALTEACEQIGARLQRAFTYSGTPLERKHNVHRWYALSFPSDVDVQEAAALFAELSEVSAVEYNKQVRRMEEDKATEWVAGDNTVSPVLPFNDPKLIDQWHYINNADLSVASTVRAGADINVQNAWTLTTGDPSIIVAVCDEGVKYDHPDLLPNMWVNEKEKNGKEGVDDDKNGYVDDIHGYNFLSTYNVEDKSGELMPVNWTRQGDSGHGTHVAGTVAAVNNNGIGVCGVAGGDGTPGTGVRLMTCQLFSGNASCGTMSRAKAYKYAADMGASVLQCSFGQASGLVKSDEEFKKFYSFEEEMLNYFMEHPSANNPVDKNFAIFASGNDGQPLSGYPAAHQKYISVSAFGPDYLPTSYTNYGPGTNIAAPGGDYSINSTSATPQRAQILSTLPKELGSGEYGYMQGTSMACPHVSGVAALALSYALDNGIQLTNTELYEILTSSVRNIDDQLKGTKPLYPGYESYGNMNLTTYKGKMGTGKLDALMTIMNVRGAVCAPATVGKELELKIQSFLGKGDISVKAYNDYKISDETKARLGIDKVEFFSTSIYLTCKKPGIGVITVKYIAGGNSVGGGSTTGGKLMEKDIVIIAREANDNGGWL